MEQPIVTKHAQTTEQEYKLRSDQSIVTRTDKQGTITRVNPDFETVSGYQEDELLNQAHNIVRHPFMPKQAFQDLWVTLKQGHFWRGIVKNKRKNGDYYWVKATVTPVKNGYLSFRTLATEQEVRQAQDLYQKMNQDPTLELKRGQAVPQGWRGKLWHARQKLYAMPLKQKIFWPMLIMWVLVMALLWQQGSSLKQNVILEAGKSAARASVDNARNARSFYSLEVLPIANHHGLDIHHFPTIENKSLPLPATFMRSLGEMDNSGSGSSLRLFSEVPFSFRSGEDIALDGFEQDALSWLQHHPQEEYFKVEQQQGAPVFRYAIADIMTEQSCVTCHNSHPDSPKTDWQLGDVRGAIEVSIPLASVSSAIGQSFIIVQLMIVFFGLVSLIGVWFLADWLSRRVQCSVDIAERIADGDLNFDTPIMAADESGRMMDALTKMQNRLRELIYDLSYDARNLTGAAHDLDQQAVELTEAAMAQKESTEDVAATIEELTSAMQQISDQADQVQELAQASEQAASDSAGIVHQSADKIGKMAEEILSATQNLAALQNMSKEVSSIVGTIEEIAEQTNLLALNAAIEAARAGDHGRGFAVVADEVRSLSQRTAHSTNEISTVIQKIQTMINAVSSDMHEGIKDMRSSVDLAHQAGNEVSTLEDKARQVTRSTEQIRNFLKEQETGMSLIAQRIEQIAQSSVQVAQGNHSVTQSALNLHRMAEDVQHHAEQFKVVNKNESSLKD